MLKNSPGSPDPPEKKLNLNNTAELTKYAISKGLASVELSPKYRPEDKTK